ncbi:LOW QUALITY PROTEIN: cell cycle checkpoint protein RAD17-like [Actinidia eriantha]|uniref:LOW QUALITY PROTEIN: cell cycle checkpoint protein RAD17-like n=1 Tax=Actinidia eriantha TaxID=165200 RepID=UPI00258833C5|nr:LOW QUALITY PROTEIN: cell cycle checkpoint protein RAD17-like [Actinidia eriantha]
MGKRTTIVVSSSDDDDKHFSLRSKSSHSKSKSRPSSVPRANNRRTKKARLSDSSAPSCKNSNGFDEIKLFCEDFHDGFSGFKIPAGPGKSDRKDLWVDKYKPCSLEELSVHKKKVEEVKVWFEKRLRKQKEEFGNNVLLITGQAGIGKSATVHVIASHFGATVCEWNTPTPTIWQEHMHNSNSGIRYMSKLDEFENFVERTRKYGLIISSCTRGSQTSIVLLIDDLPVANGKVAYDRLNRCLHLLVQSALVPTVILITDCGEANSSDNSPQSWEELQLSLQRAGACKVAFNPITVNSIKKTLSRLCREEHCNVDAEQINLIAKASGGDIRHAITSLQYFCVKPHLRLSSSFSNGTPTYSKERSDEINRLYDGFSLPFGRDETLSLFHALGKFLHNKREAERSVSLDQDAFLVKERFARLPLKMDAPEKILCKAHGQARPVTDFLHENVLDFMNDEATDDACVVASYLSDADFLLASLSRMRSTNYEAENVVQSSATSVAVRGVLFANFHPLSSRWHTIRRPRLWQVEKSLRHNKLEMARQRHVAYDGLSLSDLSVVATEFKPVLKWLGFRESESVEAYQVSAMDNTVDDDSFNGTNLDDKDNETSDDEIEDW